MKLCKKIKIEVSERDAVALEWMHGKCRSLCNWWMGKLRNGERWPGVNAAKKTLSESRVYDPGLNGVYNKLLQEVFFRLDAAMAGFFHRVVQGQRPGFPRVRPRHRFFTLIYPAMYLRLEGKRLLLPTGGGGKWGPKRYPDVVVTLTEVPPEGFGEVAVSRDDRGTYYCSFVYDEIGAQPTDWKRNKRHRKKPPSTRRKDGIVAFDLGVKTLAPVSATKGGSTTSAASRAIGTTTSN